MTANEIIDPMLPKTAASVSGAGWTGVISNLKTLLETGEPMHP